MRSLKPKELIRILQDKGFYISQQKGSHVGLRSCLNPKFKVIVPLHHKDLKPGTLSSILRQAGITKEEV